MPTNEIEIRRNGEYEIVTVRVTKVTKGRPMTITGCGYGDAEPPEPGDLEFEILDEEGFEVMREQMSEYDFARVEAAAMKIADREKEE